MIATVRNVLVIKPASLELRYVLAQIIAQMENVDPTNVYLHCLLVILSDIQILVLFKMFMSCECMVKITSFVIIANARIYHFH